MANRLHQCIVIKNFETKDAHRFARLSVFKTRASFNQKIWKSHIYTPLNILTPVHSSSHKIYWLFSTKEKLVPLFLELQLESDWRSFTKSAFKYKNPYFLGRVLLYSTFCQFRWRRLTFLSCFYYVAMWMHCVPHFAQLQWPESVPTAHDFHHQ